MVLLKHYRELGLYQVSISVTDQANMASVELLVSASRFWW